MTALQAIRGTRDILPLEIALWQRVEQEAAAVLHRAGYGEIRTPIFETTPLFERGIGEATDIVGKEMYSFCDRGDRPITLRPEGTAGVARAFIEHKLYGLGGMQRLWYTGPMFRYERPQAGRQRQFHQLGVEVLGSADPRADGEVIALACDILRRLGLEHLHLQINSVGTAADRQTYRQALVDFLTPHRQDLDADSQDRLQRNPLRILDSKDPKTQAIVQDAPKLVHYLGEDSQRHFGAVQELLTALDIPYELNPNLVRGLDYYTHTAFEIQSSDLGAQATVCGGGRYDGLMEQLGGPSTPAIGWAMGLERLILLLQQKATAIASPVDFYIVSRGEGTAIPSLAIAQKLRQADFSVELDLSGSAFNKQFKRADQKQAIACVILGDNEATQQTLQLKWLGDRQQETLSQGEFWQRLPELRQTILHWRSVCIGLTSSQ